MHAFEQIHVMHSSGPDQPFHNFKSQDQEIGGFCVPQDRRGFEAPKLWSVGEIIHLITYSNK